MAKRMTRFQRLEVSKEIIEIRAQIEEAKRQVERSRQLTAQALAMLGK